MSTCYWSQHPFARFLELTDKDSKSDLEDFLDIDGWQKVFEKTQEMVKSNKNQLEQAKSQVMVLEQEIKTRQTTLTETLPLENGFEQQKTKDCESLAQKQTQLE